MHKTCRYSLISCWRKNMVYAVLYTIYYFKRTQGYSNGYLCKCSLQLGGIHVHNIFRIPNKENLTPHRWADLEVLNLLKKPQKMISYALFT